MIERLIKQRRVALMLLASLFFVPIKSVASESSAVAPAPTASSQVVKVTGVVVDEEGEPAIGATVMDTKSKTGAATDLDGRFTLMLKLPTSLTVSYIGYQPQTVKVTNTSELRIKLATDKQMLDEVVVVGYGQQKRETMTGAVAALNTSDIEANAQANLANALTGRLPGLTTLQTSGMPGADDVTIYLRGASTTNGTNPLILIDGVPRDDLASLDPNEVKSVSILKDASATAVFGVRGANGVILVTTRRGDTGKANVSITANYSMQQFIAKPTRLHSWEFADLRNQAFRNDGTAEADLPYSPYMIQKYRDGSDPVFFPDRDIYSEFYKKWAPQTRINVNVSGGTDKVKYFLNVGYLGQEGQLKTEDKKALDYDPSFHNSRYNIRGNLDFNLYKNLKLQVNLGSYMGKVNSPCASALHNGDVSSMVTHSIGYIWGVAPTQPGPTTAYGYTMADGTAVEGGEILKQEGYDGSIYGDLNRRGYTNQTNMKLNSSVVLDWGLDFITKGLSTKFMASFDVNAYTNRTGERQFVFYESVLGKNDNEPSYYTLAKPLSKDALVLKKSNQAYYYLNLQYSINYTRDFGPNNITAMALLQRDAWQKNAADLPYNMIGVSGRVTYNYDSRYLAEVNLGYNGSEQFAKGHRFGFFPAFSAGWVISNEKFMRDNTFISNLKLRASYGKVGNDNLGSSRFMYLDDIVLTGSGTQVNIPSLGNGQYVSFKYYGNPEIGWEIAHKQNYGVDLTILGSDLKFSVDYFRENRSNILISRSTIPALNGTLSSAIPKVNMGKVHNSGFEFDLNYNHRVNKNFMFGVKGNFAYNINKVDFVDEVPYNTEGENAYAYMYRKTGYSLGQTWGYKINYDNGNGYINTPEELAWAENAYKIGKPRMGDFLYKDVTGDGVVDERDLSPIKYSNIPRITYGFTLTAKYRDFDFSALFSGVGKVSMHYSGHGVTEGGIGAGFYTDYHLKAWTQDRYFAGEEIKYPALSSSNSVSTMYANDFFIMDRSFLRLKNIELGYSLPKKILRNAGIQKVRFYVSGTNLLTFSKINVNTIDPEQAKANAYPLTKMVTVGGSITF